MFASKSLTHSETTSPAKLVAAKAAITAIQKQEEMERKSLLPQKVKTTWIGKMKSRTVPKEEENPYIVGPPIPTPSYVSPTRGLIHPLPSKKVGERTDNRVDPLKLIAEIDAITPDLEPYHSTLTREVPWRPAPYAFKDGTQLKDRFEAYLPTIFEEVRLRIREIPMTFNKKSRLGYPYFTVGAGKAELMLPHFQRFNKHDFDEMRDAFTIINVRLQDEAFSKVRTNYYIEEDGSVLLGEIDHNWRLFVTADGRFFLGSRTRDVFNPSILNHWKGRADDMIHHVYMLSPTFHHSMSTNPPNLLKWSVFIDFESWERLLGELVKLRGQFIGEGYEMAQDAILRSPILTRTSNEKVCRKLTLKEGYTWQLASGDSVVAPGGKEGAMCVVAGTLEDMGFDPHLVIRTLLRTNILKLKWNGRVIRLLVFDFGDDLGLSSDDRDFLEAFMTAMIVKGHPEIPPKFLGWERLLKPTKLTRREWVLSARSFINKTYRPETACGSPQRPFPFLGRFEKIEDYRLYGDDRILDLMEKEEKIYHKYVPRDEFKARLEKERILSLRDDMKRVEKDYLLNVDEKIKLGLVDVLNEKTAHEISLALCPRLIKSH
jgi:hypothetical protein